MAKYMNCVIFLSEMCESVATEDLGRFVVIEVMCCNKNIVCVFEPVQSGLNVTESLQETVCKAGLTKKNIFFPPDIFEKLFFPADVYLQLQL